jgi:hypothetical protein
MTQDLTPEAVAELIYELRESFALLDGGPDDWDIGDRTADMLEDLAAKLDSTLKDRALILAERDRTFALMLARAEAEAAEAEAENARLREALRWQADQPEAHPFMAQKARAALTTKEQTNE